MNDKKQTIHIAYQLLCHIYEDVQNPKTVTMLWDVLDALNKGNLKPLLKLLRSTRRDITQIINKLNEK